MAKTVNAYRASEYIPPMEESQPYLGHHSFLSDLQSDAVSVAGALKSFPYGSTLKLLGVATVLYIGFKVAKKFVNIEETIKKALRSSK